MRPALAAAVLLAVVGCSSLRETALPDRPFWKERPTGSLGLVYSRQLVSPEARVGEPYELGRPALDVRGRRVFVGSSDRNLYAVGAATGETLWRFQTLGFVQSAPLYDAVTNVVYFGSNDGALYKVRADDGALLWRFSTNSEVSHAPVLSGGRLFFTNANDTVIALDPETGRVLWTQHRAPASGMAVAGHGGALVWRGKVYTAFSDGTVTAFDAATGVERWQPIDLAAEAEQTSGDLPQHLDADTTPVPDDIEAGSVVFAGAYAAGVFALDAESGSVVWSNPAVAGVTRLVRWGQPARAAAADRPASRARELLLCATGTTGLWALDPATGAEIWHHPLPSSAVSTVVPFEGALLVGGSRLGLYLVSPIDGGVIDGIHTGEGVWMTPAVHGRRAFVVTNGGKLLSLALTTPRG